MEPQPARFVDGGMDGESSPEEDGDGVSNPWKGILCLGLLVMCGS